MWMPSTSRREKHLRSWRSRCRCHSLRMRGIERCRFRSMRTWRGHNMSWSRHMRLKTKNYRSRMTSSTKHSHRESLELGSRSSTGRVSTMRWRDSMLICRVNLKRRKHCGKESLTFWRNKKTKPRKTMKMPLSSSSKQWINFRSLRMKISRNMSTTMGRWCTSWSRSSRRNWESRMNLIWILPLPWTTLFVV